MLLVALFAAVVTALNLTVPQTPPVRATAAVDTWETRPSNGLDAASAVCVATELLASRYWPSVHSLDANSHRELFIVANPNGAATRSSAQDAEQPSPISRVQTSAARPRRANPKRVAVGGGIFTTVAICLAFFGIGTLIGWLFPDGFRQDV
ncbi:hypothetical protein CTRI78_v009950 [Colletotrichum trifolii]|uniref:Uncharacterized protein n=1 Tax=Colletotrichum trifolii TaxID=5466 RepID=A0A4R8QWV9_COLTR|nr:hypothetical protein CTRI78_v009950 [Colletotrichum trifolii]